jgi:hypothetical protein
MSDIGATFTAVYPYGIALSNDCGYLYEVTVRNNSAGSVIVDDMRIDLSFGPYGHPQNSIFVYRMNDELPPDSSALALPEGGTLQVTTQIRIGFTETTKADTRLLLPGNDLVLRMTCPYGFSKTDAMIIEDSMQIAIVPA